MGRSSPIFNSEDNECYAYHFGATSWGVLLSNRSQSDRRGQKGPNRAKGRAGGTSSISTRSGRRMLWSRNCRLNISLSKLSFIASWNFKRVFLKTVFFKLVCRIAQNVFDEFSWNFLWVVFIHYPKYWFSEFLEFFCDYFLQFIMSGKKTCKTKFVCRSLLFWWFSKICKTPTSVPRQLDYE